MCYVPVCAHKKQTHFCHHQGMIFPTSLCCSSIQVYITCCFFLHRSKQPEKSRVISGYFERASLEVLTFLQLNSGLGRLGTSTMYNQPVKLCATFWKGSRPEQIDLVALDAVQAEWMGMNHSVWRGTGDLLVELLGSITEKCGDILVAQETSFVCDNDVVRTCHELFQSP